MSDNVTQFPGKSEGQEQVDWLQERVNGLMASFTS